MSEDKFAQDDGEVDSFTENLLLLNILMDSPSRGTLEGGESVFPLQFFK